MLPEAIAPANPSPNFRVAEAPKVEAPKAGALAKAVAPAISPDASVPAAGSEPPKVEAPAAGALAKAVVPAISPVANVAGDERSPPKKRQKVEQSAAPANISLAETLFAQIERRDPLAMVDTYRNGGTWDLPALLAALGALIGSKK